MRLRVTIEVNLKSGEYEVNVKNLSDPGVGIDAELLDRVLRKVVDNLSPKLYEEPASARN
jgi:hypothetical protein